MAAGEGIAINYWGEIKDPVHGYVYITEKERQIIDSFAVQRLRRIRQLAGSEDVYPGANHTRFEHSVGVMHLAGRVVENPNISSQVDTNDVEVIRIAALLHDVGHGPFSHVFEHLLDKELGKTHEDVTSWIITESELEDRLASLGYDAGEVGRLAVGQLKRPSRAFMDQIISSSVDVDKLDFIVRDTYHTGAEYGYTDVFRLIDTLDTLEGNLAVYYGALSALESFIIARIESFKSIYFHRVGRAAQIMLAMAMERADDELGLTDFTTPEEYLAFDDFTVWTMLRDCELSRSIIRNLETRRMLKCAYERTFYEKDTMVSNIFSRESYRAQLQSDIANEARVDVDSIVIDVPTVTSVPYRHSALMEPMEIPVFHKTYDGTRVPRLLSEISRVYDVLKGFINILRVYTQADNRERVAGAALKILGEVPLSAKISY